MKKTPLATIMVVVLAHIVLFGVLAIRGGEANGEPSAQEATEQAAYDEPRVESRAPLDPPADAGEVLERYAATQDRIYASFHINFNEVERLAWSGQPSKTVHRSVEIWYDGSRHRMLRQMWGNTVPDPQVFVPKDDHQWTCWLWDGTLYYIYGQGHKTYWTDYWLQRGKPERTRGAFRTMSICRDDGHLERSIAHCKSGRATDGSDSAVRGYIASSDQRMDVILRRAHAISLRDDTEIVGGSACYILDAGTDCGEWNVWFDPAHGYNVARMHCKRGPGHLYYENPLQNGESWESLVENVRFKEFNGVWSPVEADVALRHDKVDGTWSESHSHYERTLVALNPTFPEGTFAPDMSNGALARVDWLHPGMQAHRTGCTWQNGQVLDPQGRAIKLTP